MSAAGRFAAQLDAEFEREVEGRLVEVTQKVAMEALSRVVLKTPVDTGRARGNWSVSVGAEDMSFDPDLKDQSGQPTIAQGANTIMAVQEPRVIYVQNNLPYIEVLENGHSAQAPNGMVALTVSELEAMFARVE